jgi:hypothetical protein
VTGVGGDPELPSRCLRVGNVDQADIGRGHGLLLPAGAATDSSQLGFLATQYWSFGRLDGKGNGSGNSYAPPPLPVL